MKSVRNIAIIAASAVLWACASNRDVVSIEEYDDLYYAGSRSTPRAEAPALAEMPAAYSDYGTDAERSYYQSTPYSGTTQPAPKAKSETQKGNEQPSDYTYSEEDYYDAEYAEKYNKDNKQYNDQYLQSSQPRLSTSFNYSNWGGNSMMGIGLSYGSPMMGSPWMSPYSTMGWGMGMGMGMGMPCAPIGSPFYDPWCNPFMYNPWGPPIGSPAWRWQMSFNYGWGWGNPWMNPWYNPWSPWGMYGMNPYAMGPWGWNPYAPVGWNTANPWDPGVSVINAQRGSVPGRANRGGVITSSPGSTSPDGKGLLQAPASRRSAANLSTRTAAPQQTPAQRTGNESAEGNRNKNLAPASRGAARGSQDSALPARTKPARSGDVTSPYIRQQQMRSTNPPSGGSINRSGTAPRTAPVRTMPNPPRNFSPDSRTPSGPPASQPSFSPQRNTSPAGGGGGSSVPVRRR